MSDPLTRGGGERNKYEVKNLKKQFKKLDQILTGKTSSNDAGENMNIVKNILAKSESKSLIPFNSKRKIADAAKLFLSLEQLTNPSKCNKEGLKIVRENSVANSSLDRVRGIFAHYVKNQEAVCSRIFPGLLRERLDSMDRIKLRDLEDFVQKAVIYINRKGENRVRDIYDDIKTNTIGPVTHGLNYALEYFFEMTPYDRDDIGLNEQIIRKRIEQKYLIEPCQHYCENLADIFDVASLWLYFNRPNSNEFEFYYGWWKYKFCNNALKMVNKDWSS